MAPDPRFQRFQDWELMKVCLAMDPEIRITALGTQLLREWSNIPQKEDYIRALDDLKESVRVTTSSSKRASRRRRAAEETASKLPFFTSRSAAIRSFQRLKTALQSYLDQLRHHITIIDLFLHEQNQTNAVGLLNGSERSIDYTGRLLENAHKGIIETKEQIHGCKEWLRKQDVPQSSSRSGFQEQTEDDERDVGQHGASGDEQPNSAGDGAEDESQSAGGPPQDNCDDTGDAGMGAGAPNGNDDDDRSDDRRDPGNRPKTDADSSDKSDSNESREEDDERQDPNHQKSSPTNTPSRPPVSSSSENNDPTGVIPAQQSHATLHHQAQPEKDSLSDYVASVHSSHNAQSPVGPGTDNQQVSQNAGAARPSQDRPSRQQLAPAKGGTAGGAPPGDPDGGGDGSDRESKSPKGDKIANGKRLSSDKGGADLEDDDTSSGKRQKSVPDAIARVEKLLKPVRDYYHRALLPESGVTAPEELIAQFVLRLNQASGDSFIWEIARPIKDYLTQCGEDKPGDALSELKRKEFDQLWDPFLKTIEDDGAHAPLMVQFEDLHNGIVTEKAWDIQPPDLYPNPETTLKECRLQLVAARYPHLGSAWSNYIERVRAARGPVPAKIALFAYREVLWRTDNSADYGSQGQFYPPNLEDEVVTVPKTSDRPLPAPDRLRDDPTRVAKETQRIGFDADLKFGGNWSFLSTLSIGGQGHAGLWVKYNTSGKIVDAKVIKDSYLKNWDDYRQWMPYITDEEDLPRQPREYVMGELLAACEQSFNIMEPLTFNLYPDRLMYRLYMEYCSLGDLENLFQNHADLRDAEAKDEDGTALQYHIPTPAVWCVFEALAGAACLMKSGCLPGDRIPEKWDTIFHRDIKPGNVFLAKSEHAVWRSIFVPKVGDFGLATEYNPTNTKDPCKDSVGVGTPGYLAPEAYEEYPEDVPRPDFSSASDVFCIGTTMLSLICLRKKRTVQQFIYGDEEEERAPDDSAAAFYPKALLDLVSACLKDVPGERITPDELFLNIRKEVTACEGLRDVPINLQPLKDGNVLQCKPDPYVAWAK